MKQHRPVMFSSTLAVFVCLDRRHCRGGLVRESPAGSSWSCHSQGAVIGVAVVNQLTYAQSARVAYLTYGRPMWTPRGVRVGVTHSIA